MIELGPRCPAHFIAQLVEFSIDFSSSRRWDIAGGDGRRILRRTVKRLSRRRTAVMATSKLTSPPKYSC